MKYVLSAALAVALAVPANAQTTETAVRSAIEECFGWVESAKTQDFTSSWVNVVNDAHRSDTDNSMTQVYLSSQFPLEITTKIINGEDISGNYIVVRDCTVKPVDPSRGQYRYRLRPVEIGGTWNNLGTLPLEAVEQQLVELQRSLAEDSTYVQDLDDARIYSHGNNMTFWRCSSEDTLYFDVLPDGVIEGRGGWSVRVHYASIPFPRSTSSRARCPAS